MGVYPVSVDALEWFGHDDEKEGPYRKLATALNKELIRRGFPPMSQYCPASGFWHKIFGLMLVDRV